MKKISFLIYFGIILGILIGFMLDRSHAETFEAEEITFNKNIKSIFQTNCSGCHPGIVSYKVAVAQKNKILKKVTSINKQMPPPYVSPRLSKGEVDLIKEWVNNGAKE